MTSKFSPLKMLVAFMLLVLSLGHAHAQAPQKLNYQAIVRDAQGQPLQAGANVNVRFTIHDGTPTGPVVFTETNVAVTNQFGLITQVIGGTLPLNIVNWGSGPKYLQVEIDPAGGVNFNDMGTSQLLSVPYALYAENGGAGSTGATVPRGHRGHRALPDPPAQREQQARKALPVLQVHKVYRVLPVPPAHRGRLVLQALLAHKGLPVTMVLPGHKDLQV